MGILSSEAQVYVPVLIEATTVHLSELLTKRPFRVCLYAVSVRPRRFVSASLEEIMVALIVGIVAIAFAVFACLPGPLAWWADVLVFLRGSIPVFAAFIGLIAVFIGVADIKDRMEARKEEAEEAANEKKELEEKKD
jgi:hypothetical protein